jgi:uncharacterized lipoprotein YbaY
MKFALSRVRSGAALALVMSFGLSFSVSAQDTFREQGGISSPLLSRCAGKFGGDLRAADNAFPGMSLMGVPWLSVERTDQTVEGAHIATIVTGIGTQNRRRGQIVGLRFRCLIDDKGAAVSFTWTDLLPESNQALPPAMVLRGSAYYEPKAQLAPGAELRVQLFDQAASPPALLTESVVRSSWVQPIPFSLRLPPDAKLQGRKLVIDARLSLGAATLYRLKAPRVLSLDQLQQPIDLTINAVVHDALQ